MNEELRPGQVAAAAGVNLETLRYYERRGLLGHPDRTLGGHRVYGRETVKLLRSIKTAQRLGFTPVAAEEGADLGLTDHQVGEAGVVRQQIGARLRHRRFVGWGRLTPSDQIAEHHVGRGVGGLDLLEAVTQPQWDRLLPQVQSLPERLVLGGDSRSRRSRASGQAPVEVFETTV